MFLFGGLIRRAVLPVVLLAVVGGAAWWFFVRSDATIKTDAPVIPASVAGTTSSSASDASSQSRNVLTGLATLKVNFGDFGLQIPSIAGIVTVQDGLTLQATIVAQSS